MTATRIPSLIGASVFGFLFLVSCYHLRLLNHRKAELFARSYGAQATLDEPFRRSLRAKAAFHFVVILTCAFELPLYLAFHFNKQHSADDDGCSSDSVELSLVSFEVPNVEPRSWANIALASHLIASAGYPIVLVIIIGMWAEVIRNVPGIHRPSMAVRDHGSNHEARNERRSTWAFNRSDSHSSYHSHRSSSISSRVSVPLFPKCCCCDEDEDDRSDVGFSMPEHHTGLEDGRESESALQDFECCGTRPLKRKPLLISAIVLYFSISIWASLNALLLAGSSFNSFHNFLTDNKAYEVQFILEPPLLFVLAVVVFYCGRRLRHRVKYSDGPRLRKVEGKIALVSFVVTFLVVIRAFAVLVAVFSEFHAAFLPDENCENGNFGSIPLVWTSLLATALPRAGLFAGLLSIMGCPKEIPPSAQIEDNTWNRHSDISRESDEENHLGRSQSSPPVLTQHRIDSEESGEDLRDSNTLNKPLIKKPDTPFVARARASHSREEGSREKRMAVKRISSSSQDPFGADPEELAPSPTGRHMEPPSPGRHALRSVSEPETQSNPIDPKPSIDLKDSRESSGAAKKSVVSSRPSALAHSLSQTKL